MLTASEFGILLSQIGEPVTVSVAKSPGVSVATRAIVQDIGRAPEAIVNAYGLAGRSVQMTMAGLTVPPEKFDTITRSNGERITLDLVNPQHERGTGNVIYFIGYGKGK